MNYNLFISISKMNLHALNMKDLRSVASQYHISTSGRSRSDLLNELHSGVYRMNSGSGAGSSAPVDSFREIQRQRHAQRAIDARRREQETRETQDAEDRANREIAVENARLEYESVLRESREAQEQEDRLNELLMPLTEVMIQVQNVVPIVQEARSPGQIIPYLRQLSDLIDRNYNPQELPQDNPRVQELTQELQTAVSDLIQALNTNQNYIVRYGSVEMETIYTLMLRIGTATGVEFEMQAPVMNTDEDELLARELQEFQNSLARSQPFGLNEDFEYQPPRAQQFPPLGRARQASPARARQVSPPPRAQQAPRAPASRPAPRQTTQFTSPARRILNSLTTILNRLESLSAPTIDQLREILETLRPVRTEAESSLAGYEPEANAETDEIAGRIHDKVDAILDYVYESDYPVLQQGYYVEQLDEIQKAVGR
jgi:hypothetical protein